MCPRSCLGGRRIVTAGTRATVTRSGTVTQDAKEETMIRKALAVAFLLTFLAACDSRQPTAAPAGSASASPTARSGVAWARCMREHGINVPDPDPATGQAPGFDKNAAAARDPAKWQAATQACAALAPVSQGNSPLTAEEMDQARVWSDCMRANGVPVPDPDPNQPHGPHFERLNVPLDVIDRANQICKDKRLARWGSGD